MCAGIWEVCERVEGETENCWERTWVAETGARIPVCFHLLHFAYHSITYYHQVTTSLYHKTPCNVVHFLGFVNLQLCWGKGAFVAGYFLDAMLVLWKDLLTVVMFLLCCSPQLKDIRESQLKVKQLERVIRTLKSKQYVYCVVIVLFCPVPTAVHIFTLFTCPINYSTSQYKNRVLTTLETWKNQGIF